MALKVKAVERLLKFDKEKAGPRLCYRVVVELLKIERKLSLKLTEFSEENSLLIVG